MADEGKYETLDRLIASGREESYALYDEVDDLVPTELPAATQFDETISGLGENVELLDEPKGEFDKKLDDEIPF